jgi:iron-sulfur cluster repair protein YtfE (RIC family)
MSNKRRPLCSVATKLILDQHQELRRLFTAAGAFAGAAARGDRSCLEEFPDLVRALNEKLIAHFATEEAALAPILHSGDGADLRRAGWLTTEHGSQRKELEVVLRLARAECDPRTVASIFQSLLEDLLADMEQEERWLLQEGEALDTQPSPLELSSSTWPAARARG